MLLFCSSQTLHNAKQLLNAWLVWLLVELEREDKRINLEIHLLYTAVYSSVQVVYEGCIEPPKAVRGHATSYSARIDGIVLSVKFLVKHVKLRAQYGYGYSMKLFPGQGECYRFRYRNAIQAISSPRTSSSPGTSPTSVAGPDSEKVSLDASQHSPLSTTAQQLDVCCCVREGMTALKGAHAR